ncbi:MAG: T9SS type A sorting domain-containing protein, partial [Calditrichota bacterium]
DWPSEIPSVNIHSTFFTLHSAFPNPFNQESRIRFSLDHPGEITLNVIDASGREAARLTQGNFTAGSHEIVWNASGLPAGIYILRLNSEGRCAVRKTIILK